MAKRKKKRPFGNFGCDCCYKARAVYVLVRCYAATIESDDEELPGVEFQPEEAWTICEPCAMWLAEDQDYYEAILPDGGRKWVVRDRTALEYLDRNRVVFDLPFGARPAQYYRDRSDRYFFFIPLTPEVERRIEGAPTILRKDAPRHAELLAAMFRDHPDLNPQY